MAIDKAVDSSALNASLTKIADAIRAKTGGTAPMTMDEMPDNIAAIQSGGATEPYIEETYDSSGNLIAARLVGRTKVRNYAFYRCSELALTELPAGLTSIGDNAFYNCFKLALTELPAGLTSIGDNAFYNCRTLTTITFKGTPESIASDIFYGCSRLTTINVPWAEGAVANAPWGATKATINYNYKEG